MATLLFFIFPVPIIGTLVRYRASYYPKLVAPSSTTVHAGFTTETPLSTDGQTNTPAVAQLVDVETTEDIGLVDAANYETDLPVTETREQKPTFWSVFKMVWREDEQFEGLFKGCFPAVFFLFFITFFSFRFYVSPAPISNMQTTSKFKFIPFLNLFYIFLLAGTYRAIVCPYKISLARPKAAFRTIFTDYERSRILRFYQYSGLIPPFLIGIFLHLVVSQSISTALGDIGPLLNYQEDDEWWKIFDHPVAEGWIKLGLYLLSAVVNTIICTPLDVIVTRLAIQPVTKKPVAVSTTENDPESLGRLDVSGTSPRSLFNFTTEFKPYAGFIDCFRRIIKEEGWGTLYRGWWLTFLGIWCPILR